MSLLLFGGIACWVLLCASPGLMGSWVYDDLHMVENPLYDELGDLPAVWGQTSGDYLETSDDSDVRGVETYRPLTMLTLVATHVLAPNPLAHHLVGAALHLLAALLLFVALRQSLPPGRLATGVASVGAALFALHPVTVEAYVWIHGRSDVVAGVVGLGTLVWLQSRARERVTPLTRCAVALALAFGACSAKETAAVCVVGLWAYAVFSAPAGQRPVREAAAASCGVVAYLTLWQALGAGDVEHFGHALPLWKDTDLVAFAAKLVFLNAGALGSLRAAPMQSLAWLSMRPLTALEWVFGGALLVALVVTLARRRFGSVVLLSTAMATWLPTIPLSRALWFGMDRYLYTSLFLLLFTAARPLWQVLAGRADLRRPAFGAGLLVLLAASASTFVASGFYRDHHAWVFSAIEEAPEDPTRYVVAASELHMNGHDDAARTVFRTLPPPPYPRAVWEQALLVALQLGLVSEFTDMATVALAAYPSDPAIALLGVHAALLHNDAGRAVELMQVVEGSPFCAEGRARLLSWCGTQPDSEERARVLAAANSLSCPGGGTSASP